MQWLLDGCWTHAYSNDHVRHEIKGKLDLFIHVVLRGNQVRVQIDSYIIDADYLYISYPHLNCLISLLMLIGSGKLHPQVMFKL